MIRYPITRTAAATVLLVVGGAFVSKMADPPPIPMERVLLGVVLFSVGLFLQLQTVSVYRRFRTSHLGKRPAERREVLILFLSYVRGDPVPAFVEITGDLASDLGALAARKRQQQQAGERVEYWSWEQPLRAIHHNRQNGGPLRRVVLLGSKQSVVQIHQFADLVFRKYPDLKQHVRLDAFYKTTNKIKRLDEPAVRPAEQNGFDFEDFDELTQALARVVELLRNDDADPVSPGQIQIDLTGGQKPTSVVAAVVTMFSRLANLYVAPNPRDAAAENWEYDVWGYDFREERVPND